MINLLNQFFADNFVALMKVWQFHWNVKGPSFGSYHADFKELYETQIERVDSVAERVRSLGGTTLKSLDQVLSLNHIQESTAELSDMEMWAELKTTWGLLLADARNIREKLAPEDGGTANFIEGLIEEIEKELWMISMRVS